LVLHDGVIEGRKIFGKIVCVADSRRLRQPSGLSVAMVINPVLLQQI